MVPNGVPLSKIRHAAFDAHLIGIDPDYKFHVSPQLFGSERWADVGRTKEVAGGERAFAAAREGLSGPGSIVVAV
jgi:putative restriction endonuclease